MIIIPASKNITFQSIELKACSWLTTPDRIISIPPNNAAKVRSIRSETITAYVMRKITLPLVLPALLSAFILTFSKGIGTFGTPAFLGLPVRFFTLSTQVYSNVKNNLAGDAYLLAIVMILISSLTIYMNVKVIGARKSFVTISGKGFRANPVNLGKLKWVIFALVIIFILIPILMPLT